MKQGIKKFIKDYVEDFIKLLPIISIIATMLWISIQLYFLIKLDSIQFFSWTRVIDDFIIVFWILIVIWILKTYLYYKLWKEKFKKYLLFFIYWLIIVLSLNNYTSLINNWIITTLISLVILLPLLKFIFLKKNNNKKYTGWKQVFNPLIEVWEFISIWYAITFIAVFIWLILISTTFFLDNIYKFNFRYIENTEVNWKIVEKLTELKWIYSNWDYVFSKVIKSEKNKKYESTIIIPIRKVDLMYKNLREIK